MAAELLDKKLENILFLTEDIKDCLHSDEKEDITGALDQLTGLIQRIDAAREKTMDLLMEKATLQEVRAWLNSSKEKLTPMKEIRRELKAKLDSLENLQREKKLRLEIDTQRKIRMIKEKEEESMLMQRQQLEEEWLKKTAELRQVRESISAPPSVKPQSVKL